MTAQVIAQPGRPFLGRIGAAFVTVGRIIAESSHAMRCAREAERLNMLSDEELAKRGLTRDRIVEHAFRTYLAV